MPSVSGLQSSLAEEKKSSGQRDEEKQDEYEEEEERCREETDGQTEQALTKDVLFLTLTAFCHCAFPSLPFAFLMQDPQIQLVARIAEQRKSLSFRTPFNSAGYSAAFQYSDSSKVTILSAQTCKLKSNY